MVTTIDWCFPAFVIQRLYLYKRSFMGKMSFACLDTGTHTSMQYAPIPFHREHFLKQKTLEQLHIHKMICMDSDASCTFLYGSTMCFIQRFKLFILAVPRNPVHQCTRLFQQFLLSSISFALLNQHVHQRSLRANKGNVLLLI